MGKENRIRALNRKKEDFYEIVEFDGVANRSDAPLVGGNRQYTG